MLYIRNKRKQIAFFLDEMSDRAIQHITNHQFMFWCAGSILSTVFLLWIFFDKEDLMSFWSIVGLFVVGMVLGYMLLLVYLIPFAFIYVISYSLLYPLKAAKNIMSVLFALFVMFVVLYCGRFFLYAILFGEQD